jgi:hypothetical protein
MSDWNIIRPFVTQILQQQRYTNSGNYHGTHCFLTAYQIAVLVDRMNPTLKGNLPIGGKNVGPDSFARQIAWHLSDDINRNTFNGNLEVQFLSLSGLESFIFDGGHTPSDNEFSMFRLLS